MIGIEILIGFAIIIIYSIGVGIETKLNKIIELLEEKQDE